MTPPKSPVGRSFPPPFFFFSFLFPKFEFSGSWSNVFVPCELFFRRLWALTGSSARTAMAVAGGVGVGVGVGVGGAAGASSAGSAHSPGKGALGGIGVHVVGVGGGGKSGGKGDGGDNTIQVGLNGWLPNQYRSDGLL